MPYKEFLVIEFSTDEEILKIERVSLLAESNFLEFAYRKIGCKLVDIKQVKIGDKLVDAWFSDDSQDENKKSDFNHALVFKNSSDSEIIIHGKVLLAGCNDIGETCSVPVSDIQFSEAVVAGEIMARYYKSRTYH